jgi:SAM-dependent methyltransferase
VAIDPSRVNADGYDHIAERYAAWGRTDDGSVKARYRRRLLAHVPDGGARIVDLGCGTGAQVTRHLAERHHVVGVDRSRRSLALAGTDAPGARFVLADLAEVAFAPASVDAVAAFFSVIHVPRARHAPLFAAVHRWLRPGGVFVVTLGLGDTEGDWGDLLGARLFWSSWDRATSLRLLADAGFTVESAVDETEDEDGIPRTHLWVVARRTRGQR